MKSSLSILILSITLTLNVHGERESNKHRISNINEVEKVKKAFQEDKELKELLVKVEKRLEILGINKKFAEMVVGPKRGGIRPKFRNHRSEQIEHKERSKKDHKRNLFKKGKKKSKNRGKHKFERRNEGNHGVVVVK